MIVLEREPTLTDLHHLIDKVPNYPVAAGELVELAKRHSMPDAVIDFYKSFPEDEFFDDKDDLLGRTESIEILAHQDAPMEEMRTPEED